MTTINLQTAADMCRAREMSWRAIEEQGGNEFHTAEVAYTRALEAMTCADIIDEMIEEAKNQNSPQGLKD